MKTIITGYGFPRYYVVERCHLYDELVLQETKPHWFFNLFGEIVISEKIIRVFNTKFRRGEALSGSHLNREQAIAFNDKIGGDLYFCDL
jgi:hypothetical protein